MIREVAAAEDHASEIEFLAVPGIETQQNRIVAVQCGRHLHHASVVAAHNRAIQHFIGM